MSIKSIKDIDLSPKPAKQYWKNGEREWREEFIYFLKVDRFHDDHNRNPVETSGKTLGYGSNDQLKKSCSGTLNGITKPLT